MSVTRRETLALLGGGLIAAAGGTAWHVTRPLQTALQPWAQAGQHDDPRLFALSYAILAPNPHNRQPWLVELSGEDTVILHVDRGRLLPHTDPYSRQITVGLGCFLELMRMAALERGREVQITPFPDGGDPLALDGRPVARCTFRPTDAAPDPLFAHVLDRRTLKEPFDTSRTVAPDALSRIMDAAQFGTRVDATAAPDRVAAFRKLTHDALLIEIETPRTYRESVELFRIGRAEVDAKPDGIDFAGPTYEALALAGLFNRAAALDTSSMSYKQGVAAVLANTDTAMAHIWQVTPGNSRADQIAAGRDWLRLNLAATAQGLGIHPLSQALQEYPEMAAHYADIHERLAPEGGTVQMFARLGFGQAVPQSPRWPLEDRLIG